MEEGNLTTEGIPVVDIQLLLRKERNKKKQFMNRKNSGTILLSSVLGLILSSLDALYFFTRTKKFIVEFLRRSGGFDVLAI